MYLTFLPRNLFRSVHNKHRRHLWKIYHKIYLVTHKMRHWIRIIIFDFILIWHAYQFNKFNIPVIFKIYKRESVFQWNIFYSSKFSKEFFHIPFSGSMAQTSKINTGSHGWQLDEAWYSCCKTYWFDVVVKYFLDFLQLEIVQLNFSRKKRLKKTPRKDSILKTCATASVSMHKQTKLTW